MNSIVIYGSTIALEGSQVVRYSKDRLPYFIRTEFVAGEDCTRALDKAKPRQHETVLNSVEVP